LHLICSCPVSIVKHIVTEFSTETTLSHHSGASVVLSTSAAASTALTGASAMTCTSSSSSHGEECEYEECALPTLWSVFSWHVCLLMIPLVSCGKMTSLILWCLYDPPTETLWQYYHVMPTPSIN
jgi:hypothetical protein